MNTSTVIVFFVLGSLLFISVGLGISSLLRPHRPTPSKQTLYECGEDNVSSSHGFRFNVRFYGFALLFLLFEAELVFLFPWATVFTHKDYMQNTKNMWAYMLLGEMLFFVCLLAIGLLYAWRKGFLDWEKPQTIPHFKSKIPDFIYEQFNEKNKPL